MQRGEIWHYQVPGLAGRTVLMIAAQAILDSPGYRAFPALTVADTDPGHLLGVNVNLDGTEMWMDAAAGLVVVRRSLLAECLGQIPADTLATVDQRLSATLGH